MSKLSLIRESQRMTQEFVAETLGVTVENYQYLEENPLQFTPSLAEKLVYLFKVPASQIFLS